MELIDFFRDKRFFGCDRMSIRPHIQVKQLKNAAGSFGIDFDPEEVVVLIDDSAFGSGKEGVLICDDRLIFREVFNKAVVYQYSDVESISCVKRKVIINGREVVKLVMPGKDELSLFFRFLGEWISTYSGSTSRRERVVADDAVGSDVDALLQEFLIRSAMDVKSDKVYVRPNIPAKKIQSAVDAYGNGMRPEDLIMLADDTVFGSAKEGVLITKSGIYIKALMDSGRAFGWDMVESIDIRGRLVYINDKKLVEMTRLNECDLGVFFDDIHEFLNADDLAAKQALLEKLICPDEVQSSSPHLAENGHAGNRVESEAKSNRPEMGLPTSPTNVPGGDAGTVETTDGKLAGYVSSFIADNKSKIVPVLFQAAGDGSRAALQDDANILRLSEYLYVRLPSVVRLAVSDAAFHQFMLRNREKLLGALLSDADSPEVSPQTSMLESTPDEIKAMGLAVQAQVIADHPEQCATEPVGAGVPEVTRDTTAKDKLLGYVAIAIEQNKSKILPFLKEKTGEASLAVLKDDANVEKLASFLYALLPALVRLALREDVFVQFMLDNRNKILEKLTDGSGLSVMADEWESSQQPAYEVDDFELQLKELLGEDEPTVPTGDAVLEVLDRIVESFRQDAIEEPESKFVTDLGAEILSAIGKKVEDIKSFPREKVEEQVGFMLSFMYGFAYHKVPESLRQQDQVFEGYVTPLLITLERYKEICGHELHGEEMQSRMVFAYGMAKMISRDQLSQMVRKIIDEHKTTAVPGDFPIDHIMALLREANMAAERWVNSLTKQMLTEESEVQRKWGDLLR